jgi:purine-binding chemotaxis protein CheW
MTRQITTFILGSTRLGVDILLIKEIYRHMSVTPVPASPKHIRGLMNLRGRVVTVIDLAVCLGRPPQDNIEENRLLVLKTNGEISKYQARGKLSDTDLGDDIVGLLIDRMDDVIEAEDCDIMPAPSNLAEVENALIRGVIKQKNELIIILNIPVLLEKIMDICQGTG